jgi:glycosyltransferase involved in cell wall biosynthesis
LSVVIPTLGRPILIQTLEALINADGFEQLQVIIVGRLPDPELAQKVREMIAAYPSLSHLDVAYSRGDSSEKKNAGWRAARSDIVAFLDDDVVVAPDWPLRMREAFMLTAITMLCVVGVYFVRGNPFDLMVMAIAGVIGFILRRQGYPMAPLVIGMVLGPTLEMSLRQGLIITNGDFMAFFTGHPIAVGLTLAALGMLSMPLVRLTIAGRAA